MLRAQVVALLSLGQRHERQRKLQADEHAKQRELDRVRSARDAAAAAMRARTEFLGLVSHELHATLSAIMGWAELLRTTPDATDRNRRGIDIIFENALAQNRLVDDLLDHARIAAGELSIASQPMDLAAVVSWTIDSILPAAHERQVEIAATLPPLGCALMGDAQRLRQVVWNLLANAIKFSPEGSRIGHCTLATTVRVRSPSPGGTERRPTPRPSATFTVTIWAPAATPSRPHRSTPPRRSA